MNTLNFEMFSRYVQDYVLGKLQHIECAIRDGHATVKGPGLSYPNTCLVFEFANHYLAEFCGFAQSPKRFRAGHRTQTRNRSINEHFQQFHNYDVGAVLVGPGSRWASVSNVILSDARIAADGLARIG